MLEVSTREQCEQFQMSAFNVSCATCGRPDRECPWNRRDEPAITIELNLENGQGRLQLEISGSGSGAHEFQHAIIVPRLFRTTSPGAVSPLVCDPAAADRALSTVA
jgi:hypothetical protein